MAETERQLGFVIDLNKCMGCWTCAMSCKIFWTNDKGMDHMWWMKVNTMPGRGYPKDWEKMGGGYDGEGKLVLGKKPTMEDLGGVMQFNYEEVFYGGKGLKSIWPLKRSPPGDQTGTRTSVPESTRIPTFSTFPGIATTVANPAVPRPAPSRPLPSGQKTAWCSSTKPSVPSAMTLCAGRVALTRRSSSTTSSTPPRSATPASPGSNKG